MFVRYFSRSVVWVVLFVASQAAMAADAPRQWRVHELQLTAAKHYDDPLDWTRYRLRVSWLGPDSRKIDVDGFWDGERTWRVRFTPSASGRWTYQTTFSQNDDAGLHGHAGAINVTPPGDEHLVARHGGHLRVSANRRYLTYSDGTPFFWLGDTWWNCPSASVPPDVFQQLVDRRVAQGFTVFQAHGHRELWPGGPGAFDCLHRPSDDTVRYWRTLDRYYAYAEEKGLVGAIGFAGHSLLDPISLDDLERLWFYFMARYGAYPITSLITQEYNADIGKLAERLPKMLALGQFIHDCDPYGRAMTAHPWCLSRDRREAWNEPWYDFIMLQAGHRWYPGAKRYHDIYFGPTRKPMLEAEANYEGFRDDKFTVDDACIRRTAYSAIQTGSFGFTYGAQGLYAGVLDRAKPGPTYRWGPVLTWQEGLELAGGAQLQHLRKIYESVAWWKLEPLRGVAPASVLVKADGNAVYLLYYIGGAKLPPDAQLTAVPAGVQFEAAWLNPRTGAQMAVERRLVTAERGLTLPPAPDAGDWVLLLRRESAAQTAGAPTGGA